MLPSALVYGLADLLIPELARCSAAGSHRRIRCLTRRSLRAVLLYGIACGGVFCLLGQGISLRLYQNPQAGKWLGIYGLLVPMLYCDAIIDAMNKGLGLQQTCVRYNIFTAILDVVGLYILLPRFGMWGYFISFFISHAINFGLSLWLLLRTVRLRIRPAISLAVPIFAGASLLFAGSLPFQALKPVVFFLLTGSLLWLGDIVGPEDLHWLKGMLFFEKKTNIL
jgi:O-antigen/teichoic acid export membrane protein